MENNFIAYEYKEIVTDSDKASFLLDGYENFGWELDQNVNHENVLATGHGKVVIRLKRNRKIVNKMELTRLQRNFEAHLKEIEELERSKTSGAVVTALTIGMIGTVFMAGSVFAIVAPQPIIWLSTLLAIPAFIGWILPYFVYRKKVAKQTEKMNLLIEQKYDEIYEIFEKGNKLLY
ncbi:MAG: hypothetical protein IJZ53_12490 [Tyzzerella sp.]|nr:hypothetical protein [Tyzzerella sp.]